MRSRSVTTRMRIGSICQPLGFHWSSECRDAIFCQLWIVYQNFNWSQQSDSMHICNQFLKEILLLSLLSLSHSLISFVVKLLNLPVDYYTLEKSHRPQKYITRNVAWIRTKILHMPVLLMLVIEERFEYRSGTANLNTVNSVIEERFEYRSGMANSNTVNSKFHLIRSFNQDFARFLSFHV